MVLHVEIKQKKILQKKKFLQIKKKKATAQKTAAKTPIPQKKSNTIVTVNVVTPIAQPHPYNSASLLRMILNFKPVVSIFQQKKRSPITTKPTFLMVSPLFGYLLK